MTSVLFTGGLLWSPADWPAPRAAELLATDGRIAAVGADLEVPANTERVELRGGTLLPAFADGHAHPLQAGLEARYAPVRGGSIEAILDGVRGWAADHPQASWVYGGGFDLSLATDGVFDAHWLDAIIPDRPVVLHGSDYHTVWCNSEALRLAGITAGTPDPHDGQIVRRSDGSPVGTLREWGATGPIFEVMPAPEGDLQLRAIDDATAQCAAAGITWIQDAWVDPPDVDTYLSAAAAGRLHVGVNLALRADPACWRDQPDEFRRLRDKVAQVSGVGQHSGVGPPFGTGRVSRVGQISPAGQVSQAGQPRLTANTVKFFVDGVIESGTASMLEPYVDCAHSHGVPNWDRRELDAAVAAFSAAGFQVHLHAIGDAAIRDALGAIEQSIDVIRRLDLRPVIAHLQVIDPTDLGRFAALGVIACFQPLWAQPDPLQEILTTPRIGSERAALQYPIGSLVAGNAAVSFGSDWPVTELSPLEGIATAVTRQTPDGSPVGGWYPKERLNLREALAAYTRGVAMQGFRDHAGRLAVDDAADLVWLSADLTAAPASRVRSASVRGTWLGGVRIH